jgi:hypothetical protein
MNQAITWRKALKPHGCMSCRRVIARGEQYVRCATFDNGTASTYKECAHCSALAALWRLWDYADEGWDRESFWAYGEDCREMPDLEWFEQYRQQWRDPTGDLYPVPSKES